MKFVPLAIPDVLLVQPTVHRDERGFFLEAWNALEFERGGIEAGFVQDNHSRSVRGTIRGLHYQLARPQDKLVHVVRGEVFDVAVDLRRTSRTFGRWVGEWLTGENHRSLWVPRGFAHGFCVTSEVADVVYKCTDFYDPGDARSIRWDDPRIGIDWPVTGEDVVVSERDAGAVTLREAEVFP